MIKKINPKPKNQAQFVTPYPFVDINSLIMLPPRLMYLNKANLRAALMGVQKKIFNPIKLMMNLFYVW